jgi:uncharacterized protein (TIGR02231 family)
MEAVMRLRHWAVCSAVLLACLAAGPVFSGTPAPIEVKTKITAVTVYPRRAQVTRIGQVEVPAGVHRINVTRLPYRLSPQSVRVKLMGPAGLDFQGVEVLSRYHRNVTSPEEKKLRQKMDGLRAKYNHVRDQIDVINEQLRFLRNLARTTAQRVGQQILVKLPATTDLDALLNFAAKKSLGLLVQRRALYKQRQEISKDMRLVRAELGRIRRGYARRTREAVILVKAQKAGQVKVKISYLVYGATWRPLYVARHLEGSDKVRLTMLAQIQQRTDEDWKGVRLTLSTARPSISSRPPYLGVWRLRLYTPQPPEKKAAPGYRLKGGVRRAPMASPAPPPPPAAGRSEDATRRARVSTAGISARLGSFQFKIEHPMDVPADRRYHQTTILVKDLPAKIEYLAVPARSSAVFIQAMVTNDTPTVLLPGRMNVFSGPDFVGRSSLGMVSPKQKFALSLGVDPQVRIKRRRLVFKKGDLNKWTKRLQLAWRTEITNFHQKPITLLVKDRMPVSGSPDLKLIRLKVTPKPTKVDKDRGQFQWLLTLKPGQKMVLGVSLTYRYPAKRHMLGI